MKVFWPNTLELSNEIKEEFEKIKWPKKKKYKFERKEILEKALHYKVKWKGYGSEENTWELASELVTRSEAKEKI